MAAEGTSRVYGVDRYITRGYENFEEKLLGLGAKIERPVTKSA
jgi:UDP-N-acetylglucosamine 1-carboxyvinyltransferase